MNDPLDNLNISTQTPPVFSLVSSIRVPNVNPTVPVDYRLAILGEAPGADEESFGAPFVGASGRFLDSLLSSAGVLRAGCFVGNVCKYRPPGNDIFEFGFGHEKVQAGLQELTDELAAFEPNCILALGNTALWAALGQPFGTLEGYRIGDYRGSILWSDRFNCKVVPSLHPASVLRSYSDWPLLRFDCGRARQEADSKELNLPQRHFELDLSAEEIVCRLDNWPSGLMASFDIEGGLGGWTCCSFSSSPSSGFIVDFSRYTDEAQGRLYSAVSRLLYRIDVPKVLQNSLYDNFVLYYGFNMLIRNVVDDTMVKGAEIYPELPKGLDTLASIYTRQPQWKNLIAYSDKEKKRRSKLPDFDPVEEQRKKWLGCCIDSAVTWEINAAQSAVLQTQPGNSRHYRMNMELLPALLYMQRKGFAYDKATALEEHGKVKLALAECHSRLELRCGRSVLGPGGSISNAKVKTVLYNEKGYPPQYNGRGPDKKLTADIGALLKLNKKYPNDPLLADLLLGSKLDGIRKTLEIESDSDGRVRCGYNIVGTETMRISCRQSPTGTGANLQTITKKLRKLYTADEGHWLFQCDLSGADGWTVAAHCLKHGDPTMWDDYRSGLKPAKIIALMFTYGPEATFCSREELRRRCKEESKPGGCCDQDSWLYFACKRVQHATNYGTRAKTGCEQIMEDSYKITGTPIYITEDDFNALQRFYFVRYQGLYQWHKWAENEVMAGRNLTSASGHTRTFFGRRKSWDPKRRQETVDQDTWREFLADEPQENTTYATNLALWELWHDEENRKSNGTKTSLRIQPIHQVHDALIGQFRKEDTEWAVPRIKRYFDHTLTIAGLDLVIPFEGAYGPSWGQLGPDYGGGNI